MLLCTESLILYLNKYIPSKVGYFSKIEAILPYSLECQKGSKIEIWLLSWITYPMAHCPYESRVKGPPLR